MGPDTGIDLSNCDGGLLARYEYAAAPQAPATPGPDLLEILQTLVATTHGYDADLVRLDPDQFEWAERNGYPLIIIRRADGGVVLTRFPHPALRFRRQRRHRRVRLRLSRRTGPVTSSEVNTP